ncbi:hypothetical protein U27_01338 [Candidatus Vecturithrix granuli]|uniref:DUF177 domain-containing protein n=1 Tax=Vecturithrix granuli TaxID=1499967 RepID=A0A081CA33_VECG1|nr:hypothetical protein U27_01338 [Candidatus Vecturithrix granuli]
MILQIDQLHALTKLSVDFDAQQCDLPREIGMLVTPIHLDAQVRKVREEVVIEGQVLAWIQMSCARCLKPHQVHLDDSFEVKYLPYPKELDSVEEIELNETDMSIIYYTGEDINLTELVREQVLLLLPVKPLCKTDCAGLCPSCGKDLNEGPCFCAKKPVDHRFAVLKDLLSSELSEKFSE